MNKVYDRVNEQLFRLELSKKVFDRKCKHCGYTNRVMSHFHREPCKHCGNYVFLSEKDEFCYRIKEQENRRKNDKEIF